ncbi:MAG: hypothetical protein J7J36_01845 [Thermoplasmata archaeon]|nr:hypothetical protein [Thermoplasmata archaeon]
MKWIAFVIALIFIFNVNAVNEKNDVKYDGIYLHIAGYPMFPYKVKNYIFPAGTKINVSIHVKNIRTINEKIKMAEKPFAIGNESDALQYEYNKWYGYAIRMGIKDGKLSKFLTVYMFPYRYEKGKILHADFDFNLNYSIKNLYSNNTYDLLIICPPSLYEESQRLADYKESHGIRTKVVTLEDIYATFKFKDKPEKIKYYIKDAIEQWGIKYVLLAGDAGLLPVRYVNTSIGDVPSDLYYADVFRGDGSFSSWDANGDGIYGERNDAIDFLPDVYLGRLPASNENEMNLLVDKIINFELPKEKALFIGTELFWDSDLREGEYLKECISEELPGMDIEKLYETDEYRKDGNATNNEIADGINNGAMFVNFASHGSPQGMGWQSGSWDINDLNLLHNGYKLPVVFAMACSTNEFDTTDCLGEKFLLDENGGAIAYIGSSRVAYVYLDKSIKDGLSGYLDLAFFKAYYDGYNTTGSIFTAAKEDYAMRSFMSETDRLTLMEYNMLGDPTIKLPPLSNTSRAYVKSNTGNGVINVYAHINGNVKNASLYYRKKSIWGWESSWKYYGNSNDLHWKFIPPSEGWYEFCSLVKGEQFPHTADAYCLFDSTPPSIVIEKPEKGGVYLLNKKIFSTNLDKSIIIGGIDIEVKAKDDFMKNVQFWINDELKFVDYDKPYSWKWNGFYFGIYDIKVVAVDLAGNEANRSIKTFAIL